ncbi:hypothetical protein ACT7CZ_08715 [Bacillus cereus]
MVGTFGEVQSELLLELVLAFGVSIGASIVTDGIKFNKGDWNHDGKQIR